MSDNNISETVNLLRESFKCGATRHKKFRYEQLKALKTFLKTKREEIKAAIRVDFKKAPVELDIEIDYVKNKIKYALCNLDDWMKGKSSDKNQQSQFSTHKKKLPQPYGTVLIISPWNYPVILLFEPLIGAIAAGNCAVLKPSDLLPNYAKRLQNWLRNVLNNNFYAVVKASAEDTQRIVLKQKFDYIFFTGSVPVGNYVMMAAAENMTPVTLELGGKCPAYVDSDCNIDYAAKRIAWGSCINAGQLCITVDYLLAHADIYDELVEKIINYWKLITQDKSQYSAIINKRNFDRLFILIRSTKGKIITESEINPATLVFEPSLVELQTTELDDALMRYEILGPILPIIKVNDHHQAIEIINLHEKPLQIYLFTEDKTLQETFLYSTFSGGLTVNDVYIQMSINELPFGGIGKSGIGAYHGYNTFATFSNYRTISINSSV